MWEKVPLLFCLVLSNLGAAKASRCWQGATYPETVVSPAVRSSSILRVPNVSSLPQCVAACCDLPGCDLAWLFEHRCYILRCKQRENCRPRERPGADSSLAFLRRGPPQTLVLQSLVRGEPYAGRWRSQTQSSEAPGDLEALKDLKDLALFDEARQDFADPGMVDLEYPEGGLEEKLGGGTGGAETELFPDWPDLEREMGFNQSESEDAPEGEPTEMSVAQNSASSGVNISLASQHSETEPTSGPTPTEKTESNIQSVSLSISDSTSVISIVEEHAPMTSQKRPTDATPHLSNNTAMPTEPAQPLMVSLGDPIELTLPTDTVKIEASIHPDPQTESTYSYEWQLVYSIDGHREAIEGEHNKSIRLSRLSAGQYLLTVAVSGHGAYGEGSVNITVKEALRLSNPPKAVVFPLTQVLSLPFTEAVINASQSKAGEVTVSCYWDQMSGPPIDLGESSNKLILNLSNLDIGNYTFRFTVTDATGLSDFTTATLRVIPPKASDVHIEPQGSALSRTTTPAVTSPVRQGDLTTTPSAPVSPSATATNTGNSGNRAAPSMDLEGSNRGPVAVVGPDMKLILPVSSVVLDGSSSTDDHAIVSYHWDTTSGPPGIKMEGGNAAVATVMGLRMGRYTFRLTVSDQEGVTDSASLTVRVQEARNLPPVAHASGSHTLTLPNNSLVLRGSVTDGDQTEVQYLWVRDNQSPAAGDVLFGSETQPSLYLANLVEGTYLFQLRVTDAQGRSNTATATVEVRPDPGGSEEVELELLVAVSQVSVSQRDTVLRQLAALLHVLDNDIHIRALQGHSHLSTVLQFSVQGPDGPFPGSKLSRILRSQLLREKTDYLLFRVLRVDTVLCLRRCSGHGQCDPITKECVCDPFWTENLIRLFLGDGESNCEWRVLYVILSSFMVMVFVLSATWTLICCCKRRRRTKVRKKTKYTILDNMDDQERVELRPKYSIKHRSTEHNSSLMMSESELDSDQDTIFSRDRPIRSRNRSHAHATRNGNAFG